MPLGPLPEPLGRLPGGDLGPMSAGRSHLDPNDFRIETYVDFDVGFGSFWVDLGSLLGVIFGHVGAFFGPSWSRNRLRIDLSSKKLFFTKHYVFQWFLAQIDPKMGPRSTQDRSKMGPRSSWVAFFSS